MIKRGLSFLLILLTVLSMGVPAFANDGDTVFVGSGICGEEGTDLTWALDGSGTLTLSGDGAMADFSAAGDEEVEPVPWAGYEGDIRAVVIGDGVTAIGANAFAGCTGLTEVTVPAGVVRVGKDAFSDCDHLAVLAFENPDCEIAYSGASYAGGFGPVICGYAGSTAAAFAKKYGYTFQDLEAEPTEAKNGWLKESGNWYWYEEGRRLDGWQDIDGSRYYLAPAMMTAGWQVLDGAYHYFDNSGALQTGWFKSGGAWYYLEPEDNGRMLTGWQDIDGSTYYFKDSGAMATGWLSAGDGDYYYLDSSGAQVTGQWIKSGGKSYYIQDDGLMARNRREGNYWLNNSGVWTDTWYPSYRQWGSDGVFVSRNGIIHSRHDCSGMKYYTAMSLEKAQALGYRKCQKCY